MERHVSCLFVSRCITEAECCVGVFKMKHRISLVAQWLRLHAAHSGGPGSIPGQGIRSHIPCGVTKRLIKK